MSKMSELDIYVQEVMRTMKTFEVDQDIALTAVVSHYDLTPGDRRAIIQALYQRRKHHGTKN